MQTLTPTTSHEAKEVAWPATTYISKRATLPFDALKGFFKESYGTIYSTIFEHQIQPANPPGAIYYKIDETGKQTELAAVVPVPDNAPTIKGFEYVHIPTSRAITITHYGPYETMAETYAILDKYMKEHQLHQKWMIEEYLSDPEVEKDPANWKTNIYFVL